MTREELLAIRDRAAELLTQRSFEAGISRDELRFRISLANGNRVDFSEVERLLEPDDWQESLDKSQSERDIINREHDREQVAEAVDQMLVAALELPRSDRLGKLPDVLIVFAEEHDGATGGMILGPSGSGKSMACLCLVERLVLASLDAERIAYARSNSIAEPGRASFVRCVSATSIARCVAYGQSDTAREPYSSVHWRRLLVLDDLGWEPEAGAPAIRALLAERYERGLVTIITSGWTGDALRGRYGDALLRRAIETRGERGFVIDMTEKRVAE